MKWNKKRVEELLPQVATEVQLLHPGHANTEDIFIWQPLQSGTYTTKTAVCLPPSGIATTILPWVLWAIWSTRNLHVFENRILSPMETATKALNLGREWNKAQQQIQSVKKVILTSRRSTGNNGESGTYTTCRSDAAYDKRSKRAGIAWIFSNGKGTHLSHVVEAIALRSGLLSALELEHQKLKAFSNNLTLIRAINNDMQVKEIFGIVKDIQRISSAFVEISFSHLSRSLNVEADRLAKLSLFPSRVCDPSMG
ncbi:hypothetical protein F2Q69_00060968 [Brassica cretica]|uniref:RNase H type-1 domain-containing protein n=1 Tax=Brassica cretica TaxID=69181 RepID=A0A8S9RR83_BRACR|nr:hypothetical protein F2Q69_00060968 [Brassica cretica]